MDVKKKLEESHAEMQRLDAHAARVVAMVEEYEKENADDNEEEEEDEHAKRARVEEIAA